MTFLDQIIQNPPDLIWKSITQIDELKGSWRMGVKLSPQVLNRLKKSVLVTSTGASTRIEGAKLSDQDIEKMLRGINIQVFSDRDKQEVSGYYELLNNVFESWETLNFSENLIKHFHQELLKHVDKDKLHRGEYKKGENKVHMVNDQGESIGILFDTTSAYLTPSKMYELVDWTKTSLSNNDFHPLLTIANFIVQFLQIHPFQDGNGRLSRILTNLLMLQSGYEYMPYISHEKLIEDNKPDYYLALRNSQKTFSTNNPSIEPWLEFYFSICRTQAQQAINLINIVDIEKLLSPTQSKVWQYMQSQSEVTPKELSVNLNIPRPTINQVMDKLIDLKVVERIGQGRATRYKVK